MHGARLATTTIAALALCGCPTGNDDDSGESNVCGDLTRAMEYVEGLEARASDGDLVVKLIDANPTPPNTNDNIWVIAVEDTSGTAVSGCSCVVTPWMPDHGHGVSVAPSCVESATELGMYTIDQDFIMPGYWEVTIELACDGLTSSTDDYLFGFCAEG